MLPTGAPPDWNAMDISVPPPALRLPGISMAGFSQRVPGMPAPMNISMVAHPSVTLLIDLSDEDDIVYDSQGRTGRGSAVIGLLPGELRTSGRVGTCLQIRLQPALATAVFGASADLSGTVVSLADIWGCPADGFEDRLRAAGSWHERFAIATEAIGRRLGTSPRVDPEVAHIWRRTLARRGRLRVEGLADEVGWSRGRLCARFRSQLGITPKRAARLVRFDHAAHLLAAGRPAADVATVSGYVDQPHLHRDVREFTGLTPSAVARAPWLAIDDVAWPDTWPTTT
ncbi:helix-turn-helix domain-containing protein [Streptomyces sp. NBC_00356]|uniref:helix-turn-helix domain-containing protein n=1 Tax=Streptomyces sp. NBC_00356 TaxID=2975724 RepID=UPI002E2683C8